MNHKLLDELGKHQHLLLKDKVCVIVGAASLRGIGYATVETAMLAGKLTPEKQAEILAGIPLQRAGRPVDVVGVCLFLASALAAHYWFATVATAGSDCRYCQRACNSLSVMWFNASKAIH